MDTAPRGHATLAIGGTTYRLQYDWNAVAEAEQLLGEPFPSLFQRIGDGQYGARDIRALLCAGLQGHHPGTTLHQAGSLLDEGGFRDVMRVVFEAVSTVFPKPEPGSGNAAAAAGAGTRS